MIYDIFSLSIKVILLQFCLGILHTEAPNSGKGIEIWPKLSSHVLTPKTPEFNRFLVCKGNESVKWYYRTIDGNLLTKKNNSIKVFPTDKNKTTYLSFLSLSTATYLDTGSYICSTSKELEHFEEIYIFIHDEAHLVAIPKDFKLLYDNTDEYDKVIVPFRPTSPDVSVQISTDIKKKIEFLCYLTEFRCSDGKCIDYYKVCDGEKNCDDGSDEDIFMCKVKLCSLDIKFRCDNGKCIHNVFICDGIKHCKDGSDEDESMCKTRSCSPKYPFKCNNGKCIRNDEVCDGFNDCNDSSDEDEAMCKARTCSPERPFKCDNGICIFNDNVCNGYNSCKDGSDEDEAMCKARTCSPETPFKCDNGLCIYKDDVCNGYNDCIDGSDEDVTMCKARTCSPERPFKCVNGKCIKNVYVCNGYNDCKYGSDEDVTMCKARTCSPERPFKCDNGICIHNYEVCDGFTNCKDGSDEDEAMCKTTTCSPETPFKCDNGKCIHNYEVCDGFTNCKDGSDEDEAMCKARTCSTERPFRCDYGICIENDYVCNGYNDCIDGSDEDVTMCKARTCSPETPFKCDNGLCIYKDDVCNGYNDCIDGSDEDVTMCKVKKCSPEKPFWCNNGHCIYNYNVCDGQKHCEDGGDEDEAVCKTRPCDSKTEFQCTNGQCIDDSIVCNDINDCYGGSDEDERLCEVRRYSHFDQKLGFQIQDASIFFEPNINIDCTASKNNIIENRLIPNPFKSWLHISDSSEGYAINGQNLTLKCSLEYNISSIYKLKWVVLDESENKTGHRQNKIQQTEKYFNGSVILPLDNVTTDDKGDYFCIAMATNGRNYTKKYALRVYPYDVNYLNLRIDDDVYKKTRPVGHESVQWTVRISPIQNTSLEWSGPNGKRLETSTKMTCDDNNFWLSEFIVTNVQASDSGSYTMAAYNGVQSKEIEVSLLVEEKPTLSFINVLDSNLPYYVIGKNYIFEFYISGYPLPNVTWTFEKCPNYPMCKRSDAETQKIKDKIIHISARTLKLVITMNITDTGTFICNASNILGYFSKKFTILATDLSNRIEIKGTTVILPGDTVNIQCGASKYHYQNDITWNYTEDNLTQSNFNINHSETRFSYISQILIKNISKEFNGYIVNCTVKRMTQSNDVLPETKSFTIKVEDPSMPVINNSSSTITSIIIFYDSELRLNCSVTGVPPPAISWFKNDKPLQFDENNTREVVNNEYEFLRIQTTEIKNNTTYKCEALNRIGSAILTHTFTRNYKRIENNIFSILVFFIIFLIIYLGILLKCVSNFLKSKKMTKKNISLTNVHKIEETTVKSNDPNLKNKLHEYLSDKPLGFPNERLKLGKLLGSGAFGFVFEAYAVGILDANVTTTVAVKTISQDCDSYCVSALESELEMMIRVGRHPNIVNLLGVCTETVDERLMVILEYCRFGSIYNYLLNNRKNFVNQFTLDGCIDHDDESKSQDPIYENLTLCTHDLLYWSYQVARGMEYLASKRILHGDLATRNILLAESNMVKICDFGLSKSLNDSDIYRKSSRKGVFPVKWMAIESIRELVFSTKTDVWSFGIVLWEMFSLASSPYPNLQWYELEDILSNGYRLERPEYSNSKIYNIMLDCWKEESNARPSFADLRDGLGAVLQEFTKSDYIDFNNTNPTGTHEESNNSIPTHCSVDIEDHST